MATTALPIPFTSAILAERWMLIDRTCQIMFVGEGTDRLTFVFPTSTGEPGYETRDQDRSRAFQFDPALGNGGWHDSTHVPRGRGQPAQRQHVQAALLRPRAGDPRRQQRADDPAEQGVRAAPGRAPRTC